MKHKLWWTWLLALSLLLPLAGIASAQGGTETITFPVEGMV